MPNKDASELLICCKACQKPRRLWCKINIKSATGDTVLWSNWLILLIVYLGCLVLFLCMISGC